MRTVFIERRDGERTTWSRFKRVDERLVPLEEEDYKSGSWVDETRMTDPPWARVFRKTGDKQ